MEYQCKCVHQFTRTPRLSLFSALDHDDMIAVACLSFSPLRLRSRAGLQLESHGLERGLQVRSRLPAKRTSYKRVRNSAPLSGIK